MNEKAMQLSAIQQTGYEFRIIALSALVTTAFIWVYVSMNLLWMAVSYFGFLLFISLVYGMINYYEHDAKAEEVNCWIRKGCYEE